MTLFRQLFKSNGHLFNYCEFLNYYKIPVTAKEFAVVFDAIVALFNFFQAMHLLNLSQYNNINQLSIDGVKIIDKKCKNFFIRELCRTLLPKCKPFWNSLYNPIEWKEVWSLPSKYCLTNKVKEITYKIIHLIYPVRQVVSRFLRDMETTCTFCNTEEESIKHLFFECAFTQLMLNI